MRTDIKHTRIKNKEFHGIYRGVVEDNNDPDKLGRIKVRVWGVHDEEKNKESTKGIPTDELPWSEPALGLVEGSVSGFGLFSVPLKGSHVFVFFEGGNWQSPRYFASAPGKPKDAPDTNKGFNDPDGEYPRDDRLDESDYHRLSRNEKIDETVVKHKNDNLIKSIAESTGTTWDEPESAYNAEYPNNIVLATHKGLIIEIDSTEGSERLHVYHPSNSYLEIDKDGNLVFRNNKDRFEITLGRKHTYVEGDETQTCKGSRNNHVNGSEKVKIDGNKDDEIGQDWNVDVTGNINITAGGNIVIQGKRIDLNP